jgi:glucose/arabinose dehydrogenase
MPLAARFLSPVRTRPRPRLLVTLGLAAAVPFAAASPAAQLPPGFSETTIAAGLDQPTAIAVAADGRIFVCEQAGRLRVVKADHLLARPFVTLSVDARRGGLLGVALDPDFPRTPYVYLYYTAKRPSVHNRISRVTARGDRAVPGSEVRLLDLPRNGPLNHFGGALHFGSDGALYVGVGDNGQPDNAQRLETPFGKLLRIGSDGQALRDNPFFDRAGGIGRDVWALGLRNPFTFAISSAGRVLINDVGEKDWEEIDDGAASANYGWPLSEGPSGDAGYVGPLFAYGHGDGPEAGCAITGGVFYEPAEPQFPDEFRGGYLFADFCSGWIRRLDLETAEAFPFASHIGSPVDLAVGSDGSLYYVAHGEGVVRRVRFEG